MGGTWEREREGGKEERGKGGERHGRDRIRTTEIHRTDEAILEGDRRRDRREMEGHARVWGPMWAMQCPGPPRVQR